MEQPIPHFWWNIFPKKGLNQIYLSSALRTFAISLIGLFIPLYLYKEMGFTLEETLLFFIFYSVVFAISAPLAAMFSARYGVKHAILLSVPFYLAFVGFLYALGHFNVHLLIISACLGISQAFYWIGMHLAFLNVSHRKHRGEEVGRRVAISIVSGMLGPLLGGFLIYSIGFTLLFCLAAMVLFSSAFVLFLSKEEHSPYHFSLRGVIRKNHWRDSLFFVSKGTRVIVTGVIWPLFIFVILGNYFTLGLIGSLLAGVSAILFFSVGKYSDKVEKRKIIRYAVPFDSFIWVLRALVTTTSHVFMVTILSGIDRGFREPPLQALEYNKAKGEVAAYFVSREVFICLGRILLLMIVLMTNSLAGGLIFQGAMSWLALIF